jgi:hypothetical protein
LNVLYELSKSEKGFGQTENNQFINKRNTGKIGEYTMCEGGEATYSSCFAAMTPLLRRFQKLLCKTKGNGANI